MGNEMGNGLQPRCSGHERTGVLEEGSVDPDRSELDGGGSAPRRESVNRKSALATEMLEESFYGHRARPARRLRCHRWCHQWLPMPRICRTHTQRPLCTLERQVLV